MASSSDDESRKVRPHKRSSRRGKKTRSKSRRLSSSDSSTSSHSSSSSYKRAKKKSKRKKRKGERKRVQYERERRHTRDVERDDSSSSDERRREGKKSRRSKKRRKHDYHTEAKANDTLSTKAQNETIGGIPSADKRDGMVDDVTAATANTSETNKSNHSSNSASTAIPTKSKGPMTQQQYLELQSQIREVLDPHTGRTRWMRGTGEIVERIVSREEHSRLNQSATLGDGRGFARDIARVAAMNRNGSK
eukprot:CCRYP_010648-RA/>CCRYP_010648-RA protein AED:0.45 eAED:0.45 QI:0/-1/0/1/-1/1/1/0/248